MYHFGYLLCCRCRPEELDAHVATGHGERSDGRHQQQSSKSKSFICPDCGLGVESITALTVHLLTHAAELRTTGGEPPQRPTTHAARTTTHRETTDGDTGGGQLPQRQATRTTDTRRDTVTLNGHTTTANSRDENTDDDDDDDAMDTDHRQVYRPTSLY